MTQGGIARATAADGIGAVVGRCRYKPRVFIYCSLRQTQRVIENWRVDYNVHRPHSALGQLSPQEYLRRSKTEDIEAANFQL